MAKNKSTKNATIESKQDRDELVSELADVLNKDSKEGKKVYFLDDQERENVLQLMSLHTKRYKQQYQIQHNAFLTHTPEMKFSLLSTRQSIPHSFFFL